MKIKQVNIKNFRSIENITIKFNERCRVLVGINESGKTNILKALSLLSPSFNPINEDLREALPDENPIKEAIIKFIFEFEDAEINQIFENIKIKLKINLKKNNDEIFNYNNRKINLKEFCYLNNTGSYNIDIIKKEKQAKYYSIDKNISILPNWKKIAANCPPTYILKNKQGTEIKINDFQLININDFEEINKDYITQFNIEDFTDIMGDCIIELIKDNLLEVVFWKYDENSLLPAKIDIDKFITNPKTCIPLMNMFYLAGIDDIKSEIENAKKVNTNSLRNLLNRVAKRTTKHFREIWKEYKTIEFLLEPNGNNIDISIKEENRYTLSQRSDGFKRFVSFLLLISAQVKMQKIENILLLIDETEQNLHPSSVEYLRDELIKISESNYVLYSTHSIFMIDGKNISRHLIVTKEKEKTLIKDADESNIVEEEVLYNALGYSVFKLLKEKNIIFEGWRDKKIFQVAIQKFRKKNNFINIGIGHAYGVNSIINITPILEMANRKCLIISDNDDPAKEKQKDYQNKKGYGQWKRYNEVLSSITAITGEDFIKNEKISEVILKLVKENHNLKNDLSLKSTNKVKDIKDWLKKHGITDDSIKELMEKIKNDIFNELKLSDIESIYFKFLDELNKIIKNL